MVFPYNHFASKYGVAAYKLLIPVHFYKDMAMKKLLFVCASLALSSSVFAGNQNTGCGFGSTLIENQDSVIKQVLAHMTNNTSASQTFGISSGTLGCTRPANFASNDQLNEFVASNMDTLAADIANGHGEVVDAVAAMMNVTDKSQFVAKLQSHFNAIYTSEDVTSAQVIDNIVTVVG